MSTESTSAKAPKAPSRRRAKKQEKKSLWQRDLSSLGKKDPADDSPLVKDEFQPTLPQVNLLPRSVTDSMAVARIRNGALVALVLLIAVTAAGWWLQSAPIESARADLAAAKSENAQLQGDLAKLAPIKQMYDQITKLQGVVTSTMASQPMSAAVLDRFAQAADQVGGVTILVNGVTYSGIPAPGDSLNQCPNPDPFSSTITIGCMTFQGNAPSRQAVSDLLRALEADPLFVGPYVTSSTVSTLGDGGESISFGGTVGVALDALAVPLTEEQLAQLTQPDAAAAASPADTEAAS